VLRILLIACLLLALPGTLHAKRVALVMGNAAYTDMPLRNPVNDANDISAKLRLLGFEVTTLTNRNRSQMTQAIRQFGLSASGAEAALFYFAGHGIQVRGRNYLLPVGQSFQSEAEVETEAVEVNSILARLDEAGAKVGVLILDACRNNPLARSGRTASRGLARMDAPSGALVAFAAQPGAEAQDGSGRNGTYTKHLLTHIGTPGLRIEDVFKRVRADVERETGRSQSPREESSLTADFYFVNNSSVRITADESHRLEDEAWGLCRSGRTHLPCDDYLRSWPQGRFASLARTRIRDLEESTGSRPSTVTSAPGIPVPIPPHALADDIHLASGGRWLVPGREFVDCDGCPVMVVIPAGTFMMGSPPDEAGRFREEGPQRQVSVSRLAIGKYEVTQAEWRMLIGSNPSRNWECGGDCPVEQVSWHDAQTLVRFITERTGQRYRLPTEAEWEYACRGGDKPGPYCGGSDLGSLGWTAINSSGTQRVGSRVANAFGLHDMSGNVWEWVQDCFDEMAYERRKSSDGRAYEVTGCASRVQRGGSWRVEPQGARAAFRLRDSSVNKSMYTGFRLVRQLQ
jgi:formylglycine-generating enzyme required for sulfatase activity